MSVGELASILYLTTRLKDHHITTFNKQSIVNNLQIKDMLNIAMPLTGSRLYQCLVSFLEPIILVYVLPVELQLQLAVEIALHLE